MFMQNIAAAQSSFDALAKKVQNTKLTIQSGPSGSNATSSAQKSSMDMRRQQASDIMTTTDLLGKQSVMERNNAKVEFESEKMRKSAMDARVKDHQTLSSLSNQTIAQRQNESKQFSTQLKSEMQAREAASKVKLKDHQTGSSFSDQQISQRQKESSQFSGQLKAQMQEAQKASNAQERIQADKVRGMARERYALYDVASAYQQMSTIAVASIRAVTGTAIAYERAFADVIRTTDFVSIKTGEAARVMRVDLTQLANEIPLTFGKITEIATIGNQLNIAQADLEDFTATVAKFSATTDVSTESAAMSFGRIGELLNVSDYNALGSAIAFAGVNAVATETQILAVSKEIATTAKQAKFAAPDVIGLATALSSLGIAPEAARGSIIRSFAAINKAISENGEDLGKYASLAGMSAEEFGSTWNENGATAFDALLKGLQASSDAGNNLDSVLRDLGVKNVRDIQTLLKLGDNYEVYASSIRDSNKAYEEGTFLGESYSIIQETLAAKLLVVQNQLQNLLSGLGESTVGPLKSAVDAISLMLIELQRLAKNPAIQAMVIFASVLLATVAAIASVNAIVAISRASMLAFATSMAGVSAAAAGAGLSMKLFGIVTAVALKNFAIVGAITLAIGLLMQAISLLGDEFQKSADNAAYLIRKTEDLLGGFGGLQEAITNDTAALVENAQAAGVTTEAYAESNGVILVHTDAVAGNEQAAIDAKAAHDGMNAIISGGESAFYTATGAVESQTISLGANTIAWMQNAIAQSDTFKELAKNKDATDALSAAGFNLTDALEAASKGEIDAYFEPILKAHSEAMAKVSRFDMFTLMGGGKTVRQIEEFKLVFGGIYQEVLLLGLGATETAIALDAIGDSEEGMDNLTETTKGLAKALRTVVDYAGDLNQMLSRTAELQFGKQVGKDAITKGWRSLGKAANDAAKDVRDANAELADLKADRGILEYQLSVAQKYGDTARVAKIQALLAKNEEKQADATKKVTDANAEQSKSLVGNKDAAIENRASLLGMVSTYQDYVTMLAKLGRKPAQLAGDIKTLKKQFEDNAIAAGYSREELGEYVDLFDEFQTVATEGPRDVDIEVNANLSNAEQAILEFVSKQNKGGGVTLPVDTDLDKANKKLNNFLAKARFFAPPSIKNITADAADRKISDWLKRFRTLSPPSINNMTADGADRAIAAWLKEVRTLMPPSIDGITPDVADEEILSWLLQYRGLSPISVDRIKTAMADVEIQKWLQKGRDLSVSVKFDSKQMVLAQAATALKVARAFPTDSAMYTSYIEMYRSLLAVSRNMANGGHVRGPGSSTSDSIPANLSNGEFVMKASSVKAYGVDFMNSLNQQKIGSASFSGSGAQSSSGSSIAYLSPEDRALLRAVADRPVNLYADSTKIAQSVDNGNTRIARRGAR
jgi:TP901 family phage tail tape measure protein